MTKEVYKAQVELGRGPLGTLEVAQGAERAVLLRTVGQSAEWGAASLDAWAASSTRAESLHHPSLLAVIDVRRTADQLAVATEYVQGVPLSVLIARAREQHRAIPPELAERVVLDLARAVASTEELLAGQGGGRPLVWVHPESVLVTSGDDALIADVGLLGLDAVAEHAEILAFRAPELLDGRGPNPSSVVYSLGILLWELLAGRNALGEGTAAESAAEVRRRALAGAIPRLDLVAPSAPALLTGIVSQAIHRDPADRFPDIGAFVETLSVRKRPGPGALVRFMNGLCSDLVEAQRGAVVRPQVAAASWRPTFHPGDAAPDVAIPKAPKAIGLAAFRGPVAAAPAVVIADKPEPGAPTKVEAPPVELPPAPPAHAPQATLPLILVKRASAPAPALDAPSAEAEAEELPLPRSRRRGFLAVLVVAVVAGAGGLLYVAFERQRRAEVAEPAPTPSTASVAPSAASAAPPAASASEAPSGSSAPESTEKAAVRRAREAREEREERRKKRDSGLDPSKDWGKVEEAEPPPDPKSDNPYVETPAPAPAPSSKFGY